MPLLFISANAADNPTFQNGILNVPSIDVTEQVAQYQNVSFKLMPDGVWQLVTYDELNNSKLSEAPIDKVEVISTNTFPAQVFLKVTGGYNSNCGTLGPIVQRFINNRFEITINSVYANYPKPINFLCVNGTPFIKTIPLPVYGLLAGSYAYNVNGQSGSFTLSADNVMPGDCARGSVNPCQ